MLWFINLRRKNNAVLHINLRRKNNAVLRQFLLPFYIIIKNVKLPSQHDRVC